MVGGYKWVFYKVVGEKINLAYSCWKSFEVQVGSLSKEFSNFYVVIQQVQSYQTKMRRLKQGLVE
jgi:hypothetical protein